jgi:predicted permease
LEALVRNLRFAVRTLTGARAYLFAIAVLAAGIGLSTSVFSLAQAVLFHPLPFPKQDSLRVIWKADPKAGVPFLELAYPELRDLQQGVPAFEAVAVMPTTLYGYGKVIRAGNQEPLQVESAPVSHGFFKTLGVSPLLGRDFTDADEHPGAGPVVILSNSVWRSHFQGDARIIGRQISLSGQGYTVIGVMSRDVDFPRGVGLWVPMGVSKGLDNRGNYYMQAIGRVKPGYSDNQVNAQVNSLFKRLALQYPGVYSATQQAVITGLPKYWVGSARLQLLISLGASFLLLATACITASNLSLSRTLARRQEIATRSSLGATTAQIFAQFAVEGLTAASLAGVAGLAVAWTLIKFLVRLAPSEIPRLTGARVNWQVLVFAATLSLLAALACSIAPTLMATRLNLDVLLREGGTRLTGTRRGHRMQSAFTVAQTAITVVSLAASLLVVISVRSMLRTDIGFAHLDTVTMNLALRGPQVDANRRHLFYTQLLNRLRESPAVTAVGAVLVRPLEGAIGWDMHYESEFDTLRRREELAISNFEVITPGYFQAVGTPLLEGREFSSHDREDTEKAVIVSSGLAQRMRRLGHQPVGTRIRLGTHGEGAWWKIVGVTGNTRYRGVTTRDEDIYVCYLQTGIPVNYLVIRGPATANQLTTLVRRQVAALDPNQAIANVATLKQLVDRDTARQRFNMDLLLTFGVTVLLLAAAGVYSVVAESVSVRTREIAIRLALGAERRTLTRHFVAGILRFVLIGEFLGLLTSLAAGRFLAGLLYAIGPRDPMVLTAVLAFLLVVSAFAASIPAWIAAGQESIAKKLAQAP